jgi:hypothetical protein
MIGLQRLEARLEVGMQATDVEAPVRNLRTVSRGRGGRHGPGRVRSLAAHQPPLDRLDHRAQHCASRRNGSASARTVKSDLGANGDFPAHVPQAQSQDSLRRSVPVGGGRIEIPDAALEGGIDQPARVSRLEPGSQSAAAEAYTVRHARSDGRSPVK